MSEPIKWQELTDDERTRLVFEHVTRVKIPQSFTVTLTPWKLAEWFVCQHPGAYFEVRYDRESSTQGYVHVQINLYPQDNLDMPIQRYHAHGKEVDDVLSVALLRAAGVEVNNE
jgi:hypothetical protein